MPGRSAHRARRGSRSLRVLPLRWPLCLSFGTADAQSNESVIERLDRLERENRQLRREVDALKAEQTAERKAEGERPGHGVRR